MTSRPAGRIGADGRVRIDYRALVAFAAPLMATNAIQAVLNLAETWVIGRLSTGALAGMSAIYWVMSGNRSGPVSATGHGASARP